MDTMSQLQKALGTNPQVPCAKDSNSNHSSLQAWPVEGMSPQILSTTTNKDIILHLHAWLSRRQTLHTRMQAAIGDMHTKSLSILDFVKSPGKTAAARDDGILAGAGQIRDVQKKIVVLEPGFERQSMSNDTRVGEGGRLEHHSERTRQKKWQKLAEEHQIEDCNAAYLLGELKNHVFKLGAKFDSEPDMRSAARVCAFLARVFDGFDAREGLGALKDGEKELQAVPESVRILEMMHSELVEEDESSYAADAKHSTAEAIGLLTEGLRMYSERKRSGEQDAFATDVSYVTPAAADLLKKGLKVYLEGIQSGWWTEGATIVNFVTPEAAEMLMKGLKVNLKDMHLEKTQGGQGTSCSP